MQLYLVSLLLNTSISVHQSRLKFILVKHLSFLKKSKCMFHRNCKTLLIFHFLCNCWIRARLVLTVEITILVEIIVLVEEITIFYEISLLVVGDFYYKLLCLSFVQTSLFCGNIFQVLMHQLGRHLNYSVRMFKLNSITGSLRSDSIFY